MKNNGLPERTQAFMDDAQNVLITVNDFLKRYGIYNALISGRENLNNCEITFYGDNTFGKKGFYAMDIKGSGRSEVRIIKYSNESEDSND
jgi:hypothetical protein